jgi:predicted  nucleic acid-binding Zn-ribbon protein
MKGNKMAITEETEIQKLRAALKHAFERIENLEKQLVNLARATPGVTRRTGIPRRPAF